jgi:hypothetical protein
MVGGQLSKITEHTVGYKENGNIQRIFFIARPYVTQELMLLPGEQ